MALLTLALMAPTAMAGPGNGGGHGQGGDQGHGHGKPADAGPARGHGHGSKPDKQAKAEKQAKADKQAKPDKGSKADKARGDDADEGDSNNPIEPAEDPTAGSHQHGGANLLAMLVCKDGGWQTLQRSDGTRFDNQGRCVSYAVRDGVLAAVVPVVTISFAPSVDDLEACDVTAALGDFDPSTSYVGALTVDGLDSGVDPITTDALGDASVPLGTFATDQILALTVDGVTSGGVTVACPPDVDAP